MIFMTEDMHALLAVYADATEPLDWWDATRSLIPVELRLHRGECCGGDCPTRIRRQDELTAAAMALLRQGLLLELPDGEADRCVITDAGRLVATGRNVQNDNHETEGTKR